MKGVLVYGEWEMGIADGSFYASVDDSEIRTALFSDRYGMIVIDLDGREKQGMAVSKYVRSIPKHFATPIFFLAKNREYEREAIDKIGCIDYYVKPIDREEMLCIVETCLRVTTREKREDTIIFRVNSKEYPINVEDIVYMESMDRNVLVHMNRQVLCVPYLNMEGFLMEHRKYFVRCHRRTIVNKYRVEQINLSKFRIGFDHTDKTAQIGKKYLETAVSEIQKRR